MIRLILTDLAANARVWLGTLAVTIAAGFVAAVAAGMIETGATYGGRVSEALGSTAGAVIMFSAVTALIVLGSTANLTVGLQQRGYALWQLVGIRPTLVGLVVFTQLGIVAAVGGLLGASIAAPMFDPLLAWVFREWTTLQGVSFQLGAVSVLSVTAAITLTVLLGGLRGARRAGRTAPLESLRDQEPPRIRMGWVRSIFAVLILAGTIALAMSLDGGAPISDVVGLAMLLTPLIAATFAAAGPIVYPLALRAWTALLPAHASASWFLARHSTRHRLSQSTAAIGPLMVAIAITAGLYTTLETLTAADVARSGSSSGNGLTIEAAVLLLGGPLLLSAIAAAATVYMSGQAREREFALVQAAGSTHTAIMLTAVWEALIYAVTAAALGITVVIIGGTILAAALALPFPVIAFTPMALIAAGGFILLLAATAFPTTAALRHEIPRTLAVE